MSDETQPTTVFISCSQDFLTGEKLRASHEATSPPRLSMEAHFGGYSHPGALAPSQVGFSLDLGGSACEGITNRPATPLHDAHQGGCFIFSAKGQGRAR